MPRSVCAHFWTAGSRWVFLSAGDRRKVHNCAIGAGGERYRVVNPADPVAEVVPVLPLEDQPPVAVVLLRRPVQLPVHVGAVQDHSILVRVDSLALQGIVNIVSLQGADGDRKETAVGNCSPLTAEAKASRH